MAHRQTIIPAEFQPPLPGERILARELPGEDAVEMDVVFVGGGPAGLAGAIELARLIRADNETGAGLGDVQIAVLDKASALGDHCLSGAVVNPRAFRALFPELPEAELPFRDPVGGERVLFLTENRARPIPTPPTMRNHGYYTASICEIVRWLGERAEELGVNLLPGFPVESLLVDGAAVAGVRTAPAGLTRNGEPGPRYEPGTDVSARAVVLAEGSRGMLTQAYLDWQGITSENPPIFALGVKEIWETEVPLDRVVHTLGWPLSPDSFGGSFLYPLEPNLVAIGLVAGLDYRESTFDVHELLQQLKSHPFFRQYLEGGQMVEWGAKTIPEGGYYSLPNRRFGDGILITGDAAGFVDVPSLKGIHYAVHSGMLAARALFTGLKQDDFSGETLSVYDSMMDDSYVMRDLYRNRNMRLAFHNGLFSGGLQALAMTLTGGRFPGGKIEARADSETPRAVVPGKSFTPDGKLTFGKSDAVFRSGNQTRDDVPTHLIVGEDVPPEVAELYEHMCPAGVYEKNGDALVVNAPNCVDCKATDVLGPRWTPREGGSGPSYKRM